MTHAWVLAVEGLTRAAPSWAVAQEGLSRTFRRMDPFFPAGTAKTSAAPAVLESEQ
jgi:hypothetical protein